MIKAVIFDFDGLIMDTETQEYRVIQEMFRENEAELPLEVWGRCIGTSTEAFDVMAYLEEQIGCSVDRDAFSIRRRKKVASALEKEKALPGVEAVLQEAKGLGLRIGLATSSGYEWISLHLRNLGLMDFFECIRTADDVENVKPDPALYVAAAGCLGVQPHEAIAFEDSANGAIAAKRAGMYCVVVPNKVTETMAFGDVDHRLKSMVGLELEALIDDVAGQEG